MKRISRQKGNVTGANSRETLPARVTFDADALSFISSLDVLGGNILGNEDLLGKLGLCSYNNDIRWKWDAIETTLFIRMSFVDEEKDVIVVFLVNFSFCSRQKCGIFAMKF